ncbi:MAG: DUF1826 domain-containing protein [Myxococcales bacterium]|nr:DUF1826 domain-containing protein [Myxococcales bacterium]
MKERTTSPLSRREEGLLPSRDEHASSSTVWVDGTADMAILFEPHVNVVVLQRQGHEALAAYAAKVARRGELSFKATAAFHQANGLDALDELALHLPPDDARDVLIEDLAYWIEVVTELSGSPRVGLRLVSLDAPMCPSFHVDHVTVRLVCTYSGAASEWLEERDLDRSLLSRLPPMPVAAAVRRGALVQRCEPLDVVLLKGTAWSGNETRGAVHRSPVHSAQPRLLLTIDPLG